MPKNQGYFKALFTLLILLRHSDSAVKVNYIIFSPQGRKVAV
jgi:hypothetical protein